MITNTSAPPGPVVPALVYRDVDKAIEWLFRAFGFTERLRALPEPDGSIHHAQLSVGRGSVILTAQQHDSVMVRVEDVDVHYRKSVENGAKILRPPASHPFGERQYSAEDLEGRTWTFTQSVVDAKPEDWGGKVRVIKYPLELLPRPRFCYLEIPAGDVHLSAAFYENVFGWDIRHRDTDRPSFDDATGNISGAFVAGRTSGEPGLLPYIWVDRIETTLALISAAGGEIVKTARPDQPGSASQIATFRDPGGNLIGLYHEG